MTNSDRNNGAPRSETAAILRFLVAGYLFYLGVSLIRDRLTGRSTLPGALVWVCGAAFIAAGILFAWFTWRRYRAGRTEPPAEDDAPGEDPPSSR